MTFDPKRTKIVPELLSNKHQAQYYDADLGMWVDLESAQDTRAQAQAIIDERKNHIELELAIENHYEDGVVHTDANVLISPPPEDEDEYDDWLHDGPIYEATGTGREEGDSAYFVKVVKSSNEEAIPVGTEYEFGT